MAVTEPCIYLKIYNEIQGKSPSPHYSDVSQQKGLLLGAVHYTGQYSLSNLYVMSVQRQIPFLRIRTCKKLFSPFSSIRFTNVKQYTTTAMFLSVQSIRRQEPLEFIFYFQIVY